MPDITTTGQGQGLVILPTYNEVESLERVIRRILHEDDRPVARQEDHFRFRPHQGGHRGDHRQSGYKPCRS